MIILPIIAFCFYCFIIYVVRSDAADAKDENDRMVSAMILMVASLPLMPTYFVTSLVNDLSIFKNVYLFYGLTAIIQFFFVGLITDYSKYLILKRKHFKDKDEENLWYDLKRQITNTKHNS